MAYTNLQNSGLLVSTTGAGITWTPSSAPTVGNLLTSRIWLGTGTTNTLTATDVKDSSGTPKVFAQDVHLWGNGVEAAVYSVVVPSGLTTPLKDVNTHASLQGVFDEWSGNATTLVLDQSNTSTSASTNTSSGTGPTINTGARAGLVLSVLSLSGSGATSGITDTGTSFVADQTEQDNNAHDSGSAGHRITSAASQTGLGDSWTWTAAVALNQFTAVIASYNVPAAGAGIPPGLGPVVQMEQLFHLDASLMR